MPIFDLALREPKRKLIGFAHPSPKTAMRVLPVRKRTLQNTALSFDGLRPTIGLRSFGPCLLQGPRPLAKNHEIVILHGHCGCPCAKLPKT